MLTNPWAYVWLVLLLSLAVRVEHSALRAVKDWFNADRREPFNYYFWQGFRGFPYKNSELRCDYWFTFILGCLEIGIYPILLATSSWTAIGGWIALKTVAQWDVWKKDRATFNLFLIGTLVNLVLAFLVLRPMVVIR